MLINCPECNKQISNKAISCPNCGYPMKAQIVEIVKPQRRKSTHRKLPNGFGRITEIKNIKNGKPFRAMISDGKDSTGHPIGKLLKPVAYFRTYNEAYQALIEYHRSPYDYENNLTMQELYDKWLEYHKPKVTKSRYNAIKASWKYCEEIIGLKYVQSIRTPDLKRLLDDPYKTVNGKKISPSDNTKNNMKYTLAMMFDYAVEYGYTDRNYARDIKSAYGDSDAENPHISYSKEEMGILWKNVESRWVTDMILVQCYMGWRPKELCDITLNNVNLKDWVIEGGSKTKAGKERQAVVHKYIRPIIRRWYDASLFTGSEYLFTQNKRQVTYEIFKFKFRDEIEALNLNPNHRPHDGRKQFVTMAKEADVNDFAIKLMVGHAIKDLTERVYTDRDIKWLHKEVDKIDPGRFTDDDLMY